MCRSPSTTVAREYVDAHAARLGAARVGLIAEAFREHDGKFRPATAAELKAQLGAYGGLPIYLFDGPPLSRRTWCASSRPGLSLLP